MRVQLHCAMRLQYTNEAMTDTHLFVRCKHQNERGCTCVLLQNSLRSVFTAVLTCFRLLQNVWSHLKLQYVQISTLARRCLYLQLRRCPVNYAFSIIICLKFSVTRWCQWLVVPTEPRNMFWKEFARGKKSLNAYLYNQKCKQACMKCSKKNLV
jgi:hypothetical protein